MKPTKFPREMTQYALAAILFAGVLARVLVVVLPGKQVTAAWSGSGDTAAYVTLAQNLLAGKGYSYAGQPSAFRPPGYPMLLAAAMGLFGGGFAAAVRCLQFALGLVTAYFCARVSERLFGAEAFLLALVIALLLPTLIFITGEVLTESVAAFFTALYLWVLSEELSRPRWTTALGLGVVAGLAALVRFNMAALVAVGLAAVLLLEAERLRWRRGAALLVLAFLAMSPWLVRNFIVFHGRLLFSSQSGLNAVAGLLAPQGRALPSDVERLRKTPGWISHLDLETNDAKRNELPSEDEINRQGWMLARKLYRENARQLLPVVTAKLAYFWLGTDQLFWTKAFSPTQRLLRAGGVILYWLVLVLAVAGWRVLYRRRKGVAWLLLAYAVGLTLLHLPFVMNTRMRIPLMDPLLSILAGGGLLAVTAWHHGEAAQARVEATRTGVGG